MLTQRGHREVGGVKLSWGPGVVLQVKSQKTEEEPNSIWKWEFKGCSKLEGAVMVRGSGQEVKS